MKFFNKKKVVMESADGNCEVLKAHGDLVSAVDFSEDYLVTGYEDSNVGVWSMETGLQVSSAGE